MYINIKLPPDFGAFNRFRMENYPFNGLFTSYLAALSRMGTALSMDVDELVGYIEDRVFEGERLPDVPEGEENAPVNIRYKTDDPDVTAYIGSSRLTNRMAIMYIVRMTMRLSVAYGTSLLRLTRLIKGMSGELDDKKKPLEKTKAGDIIKEVPKVRVKKAEDFMDGAPLELEDGILNEPDDEPAPRVTRRSQALRDKEADKPVSPVLKSAQAAKEALSQLTELTAKAGEGAVETNPLMQDFFG